MIDTPDSPSLPPSSPTWEEVLLLEAEYTDYFQSLQQVYQNTPEANHYRLHLNAIAFAGFQEWIAERATGATVKVQQCSLYQPELMTAVDAICQIQVNHLRICLIVIDSVSEAISFPKAAIAIADLSADFYGVVLVEQFDAQATPDLGVRIVLLGFLHYHQLLRHIPLQTPPQQPDWHDWLPLEWFEVTPAAMRLCLRSAATASVIPTNSQPNRLAIALHRVALEQAVFDYFQSSLPSTRPQLWEVFSWEQGCLILSSPDLRRWWYEVSHGLPQADPLSALKMLLEQLMQGVFNTWDWCHQVLDRAASDWGWQLGSTLAPAFRSQTSGYQQAIADLRRQGIHVPAQANYAYLDFDFAGHQLRLRAIPIPATRPNTDPPQEWRLVVILEAQPHDQLPLGISLQIHDQTTLLDEQRLEHDNAAFLYSCVVGDYAEEFRVTIQLKTGLALTLPPFTYLEAKV